jgi:hypothetical protein
MVLRAGGEPVDIIDTDMEDVNDQLLVEGYCCCR